jgi:Putative bacterial sensory transduction regulator
MNDRSATLVDALRAMGLDPQHDADVIRVAIPCSTRGSLAVQIAVAERSATLRAFVMRAPDLGHEAVYRRILRKNDQAGGWAFALDELGDVFLIAQHPLVLLDEDMLDGVFGALSSLVDETFEGLVRLGFDIPPGIPIVAPRSSGE